MRKRSKLQVSNSHYNLPKFRKKLAYKTNRIGIEDHFANQTVRKNIQMDLTLPKTYDELINQVEHYINKNTKIDDVDSYYLLRSIPGIGKILTLTIYIPGLK